MTIREARGILTRASDGPGSILVFLLLVSMASAQSDTPWNGPFVGMNAGETRSSTCNASMLNGATENAANHASFSNCGTNAFVGGLQIGEDFQTKRFLWGVGADLDIASGKYDKQSIKPVDGAGTFTYSGKPTPGGFAVVGPRLGYAGDLLLPYLRVGAVIATGSHGGGVSYVPTGSTKPEASFDGGKDFRSTGWAAGAGTEIGLNGAWSITVDYVHMTLGQGHATSSRCVGTASACTALDGLSLDSAHGAFTANVFRIGFNYWFGYWEP